jgi:hypothetical protein
MREDNMDRILALVDLGVLQKLKEMPRNEVPYSLLYCLAYKTLDSFHCTVFFLWVPGRGKRGLAA